MTKPMCVVGMNGVVDLFIDIPTNTRVITNFIIKSHYVSIDYGVVLTGIMPDGEEHSFNQCFVSKVKYYGDFPFRPTNVFRSRNKYSFNKITKQIRFNKGCKCAHNISTLIAYAMSTLDKEILTSLKDDIAEIYIDAGSPGFKRLVNNKLIIVKWRPFKKWVYKNYHFLVNSLKIERKMIEDYNEKAMDDDLLLDF